MMTTRKAASSHALRWLALAVALAGPVATSALPWRAVHAASLTPESSPVPRSSRFT
jgi:hypothetical protein